MNLIARLVFGGKQENGGKGKGKGSGVSFQVQEGGVSEVIAYKYYSSEKEVEQEQEDSSIGDSSYSPALPVTVAPRRRAAIDRSRPQLDTLSYGSSLPCQGDSRDPTSAQQLKFTAPIKNMKWSSWSRGILSTPTPTNSLLIKQYKSDQMSSFEIECMHRDIKLTQSLQCIQGIVHVQQIVEENYGTKLMFDGNAEFLDSILVNNDVQTLLSERDIALGIVKPLLQGLNYLHSAGILVRNLSDKTVLVSGKGASISDLFLHADKNHTLPFDRVGDLLFMAPEVLNKPLPEDVFQMVMDYGIGENDLPLYDEMSDIWCMGVLVFKLLTNQVPFEGGTPEEVAEEQRCKLKRGNRLPLPPFLKDLHVSEEAKMFIWDCLQIQPENRKSAEQLLDHPWIQSQPSNSDTFHFPAIQHLVHANIHNTASM